MDGKRVDRFLDQYIEDGYIDIAEWSDKEEFEIIISALKLLSDTLFDDWVSDHIRLV